VTQAQRALDMTQANYNHGAATTLDVLDAQAALSLAESTRLEALYEHANARATLRCVMGRGPLDASPQPNEP
jgi:outer membrane protein TolC